MNRIMRNRGEISLSNLRSRKKSLQLIPLSFYKASSRNTIIKTPPKHLRNVYPTIIKKTNPKRVPDLYRVDPLNTKSHRCCLHLNSPPLPKINIRTKSESKLLPYNYKHRKQVSSIAVQTSTSFELT